MTDLPADIAYGYVVGRYLVANGDTVVDVDGYPEGTPAVGVVKFTPVSPDVLSSEPATVIPQPVVASIDADGYMIDPTGAAGVWLVTGQYTVSFAFNGVNDKPMFTIEVLSTHTLIAPLDLTTAAPLQPSPATVFVVNEQVYTDTLAARDEALEAVEEARNLNPRYLFAGRRGSFIGDSHTEGIGPTDAIYAFPRQTVHHVGTFYASRSDYAVFGVGGENSTQILARFAAALAATPDYIVIECGANDANDSVPASTFIANIAAMVTLAKQAGSTPIVVGVPPKHASATGLPAAQRYVDAYNTYLAAWCPRNGVQLADIWPVLVDISTGNLLAAYANDPNQHINSAGHYRIALVIAASIRAAFKSLPTPASLQRPMNLITNGFMVDVVTPGNAPDGWTLVTSGSGIGSGAAPVLSAVTDTSGMLPGGKWFEADVTATASAIVKNYDHSIVATSASTYVTGDTLALTARLQVEDVTGDWVTKVMAHDGTAQQRLSVRANAADQSASLDYAPGRLIAPGIYDLGPIWHTFVMGSTTSAVVRWGFTVPMGSRWKIRVGAVEVINLTRLSLTDIP